MTGQHDTGRARLEAARPDYERALAAALKAHGGEKLLPTRGRNTG